MFLDDMPELGRKRYLQVPTYPFFFFRGINLATRHVVCRPATAKPYMSVA